MKEGKFYDIHTELVGSFRGKVIKKAGDECHVSVKRIYRKGTGDCPQPKVGNTVVLANSLQKKKIIGGE